ncbi:ABC transporter ATP-binding protein [Nakamurella sp. GG22]
MPPSTTTSPGLSTDGPDGGPVDAPKTPPGSAGSTDRPRWLRRLWGYCWRHPVITLLAGLSAVGGVGLGALTPLLTQIAVDDATAGSTANLGWVIAALVALALIRFGSSFLRRWAGGRLSLDVQHDMRQDVFGALQRLDGSGQDRLRTGQVVSRASSDLQMVQSLLAMVPLSAGQVVLFVVSLVIMLTLSPLLTLMALLVVPAVVVVTRATRTVLFPATWAAQQSAAEVAEIVEEDVTGVRVVKGFGQEDRELGRLTDGARRLFSDRMRAVRLTAKISPALQALTALGQVGVLALGGYLALIGTISLGTFLAFTLYLAQLVAPTRMLTMLLVLGQQARASVERVLEIVDSLPVITERPDPLPMPAGPLDVRFDGVSFGYSADDPVLRSFDVHVPAGSTLALVGASGSGKSTVSLLLPRFYDPQAGTVLVGGVDVRDLAMADLRAAVGVVFEEAFLFSDTISANISYGRPDATEAEVRAAAVGAEAAEFIEALPEGYDTVIGERGLTLSGGQRQRLALARALLTDPRVLLLDDATSAVDPITEAAIHATLSRVTADRTTILIAHRRSTLALADRIAVVVRGSVVDVGTHDELAGRCAPYRELLGSELAAPGGEESEPAVLPRAAAPDARAATTAHAPSGPDGISPELWPAAAAETESAADRSKRLAAAAANKVGGRAGGGGGGWTGMFGAGPATPELMAQVDALPAATDQPREQPPDTRRFSLGRTLRPVMGLLVVALILVAADALANVLLPVLIRYGVDNGVSAGSTSVVMAASGVALAVVGADYLIQRFQMQVAGRAGENVLYQLRLREFAHLQRLGLDYYEREMAGRIMTRMTTDVDALSSFLQTGLVTSVVSLATFVGIAVVLLVMDLGLALIAFAALPFVIVATIVFRRFSTRAYTDAREKVSIVNADLQENVAGLRVSQALGRQRANADGFAARSDDYRRSRMRAQTAISLYFPFVALLSELAAAAVLGSGVLRVIAGTMTVGTLIAFVLYLDSFFQPIQQLSQVFDSFQQAQVGLIRIGELLDTPTSTPAALHPLPVPALAGGIIASGVGFRYSTADDAAAPALTGVDVHIAPGQTVAVVGATGAGKSTLVKLIARFYDVTTGSILVDGVDIRRFDMGAYRRRLGVVPQEPHLFIGSVRDNIAYGRPEATDAEVEAAARAVGALGAVAGLAGKFHHPVNERGRNLSAGQRQLISLARAELVDPDILLLDEATAALDPAAEAAVLAATDRLAKGRTTVVVAHRLTTAARADRIIVMERGRVAEVGRHDELLRRGGAYARLYAEADTGLLVDSATP